MRIIIFTVLLVLICMPPAKAQNRSVQINLNVLDEIEQYQPPPMFGEQAAPEAPYAPRPTAKPEAIKAMIMHPPIPQAIPEEKEIRTLANSLEFNTQLVQPKVEEILAQIERSPAAKEMQPLDITEIEPASGNVPDSFMLRTEDPETHFSLGFLPGVKTLPEAIKGKLAIEALAQIHNRPKARIEIQSYASWGSDDKNSSRRISLARALALRDFLVENNIDKARIDVRALGRQTDKQPYDRADIFLIEDNS